MKALGETFSGRGHPRSDGAGSKLAFTLLELLAVMAIMLILLTIAIGSSMGWGRAKNVRGSTQKVKSSLALARQWAMTHREPTFFIYTNTPDLKRGYMVIRTDAGDIGGTNYLGKGLRFFATNSLIEFGLDGACAGEDPDWPDNRREIVLREYARGALGLAVTVTVSRVTGHARVE